MSVFHVIVGRSMQLTSVSEEFLNDPDLLSNENYQSSLAAS